MQNLISAMNYCGKQSATQIIKLFIIRSPSWGASLRWFFVDDSQSINERKLPTMHCISASFLSCVNFLLSNSFVVNEQKSVWSRLPSQVLLSVRMSTLQIWAGLTWETEACDRNNLFAMKCRLRYKIITR